MNLIKLIFLLLAIQLFCGTITVSANSKVIYLKDYIKDASDGKAVGYAILQALAKCREVKANKLQLPGGTLKISGEYLGEQYVWASNNDEGLKRFVFDLTGMKNFEIDGNETKLLLSGFVSPFLIREATGITVKNLSIDYTRTFHSEGIIQRSGKGWIDVKFTADYPYKIEDDRLIFKDKQNTVYPYSNLLEFDAIKRETAFMAKDYWIFTNGSMPATQLANGNVRVFKENVEGTPGNLMIFGAANRNVPAFILTDSERIHLKDVNIYHCGGMGIIGQRTKNIELDGVKVTPLPGSDRIVSITADATHFSNCSGYLRLLNCVFENQKDDATNIHGIYTVIDSLVSPTEIIVRLKHSQQHGFNFFKTGTNIEIVDSKSLVTYGNLKVKSSTVINKEYIRVNLASPMPKETKLLDVVASVDSYPDVIIRNCIMKGNRARGILLGSRGKILIENNYFHIPGAAILFEGDGTYWFEQSGVRDVIIKNNTFDNCNYGVWGKACIAVGTGLSKNNRKLSSYHKNILVENNTFNVFDPRIVNIYSVEGFSFKNNTINKTHAYKNLYQDAEAFVTDDCTNVSIQ